MNLNRSIRAQQESQMLKEREDDLALFLELHKHGKECDVELDTSPGSRSESLPEFNILPSAHLRRTFADDFLSSDGDKNDYDWLLTPPGTPLFPSLEMESQKTRMGQLDIPKARPTALKSRLANPQQEPAARSNLLSKSAASPGLTPSSGTRRPSSSGGPGSRPGTPSGHTASTSAAKTSRPSTPTSRGTSSSTKPLNSGIKSTVPATRSITSTTKSAVSSRSSTPSKSTARSSTPSKSTARSSTPSKSTARSSMPLASTARSSMPSVSTARPSMTLASTARSSMPSGPTTRSSLPSASTARSSWPSGSTSRSSTPTRSTARSSTPSRSTARSSTPTARPSIPTSKPTSRAATPTRRPSTPSSAPNVTGPPVRSSSSVTKSVPATSKNPVLSRGSSPMKSRPWNPCEMPGYSLEAPPNLRTTLPDRPLSATRSRPGAPSSRSSALDPGSVARARRQSCSPSRGRLSNGAMHTSGSSVPAVSRHTKINDNVSPVVIGTKMVERVINMRKLAPPKPDGKRSPTMSGKSTSSPDSSGFGRTLSKKSLDMAIRHMDIRRSVPGNLRPLMTNIPASSMYSVRSGPPRSRTASVSDSPLATSSNASSEMSVNNNGICLDGNEVDDAIESERSGQSSISLQVRGRQQR